MLADPAALMLAGIVAVAAVLRFATISDQSFWYDESLTVALARAPFGVPALGVNAGAEPPLYFAASWLWARVFGDTEAGLRSLSAVAGVLTVPVAYSAATALVSRRAGLAAAALIAVSPPLIAYSQEARSYAFFVLFAALSFMFFARVGVRSEPRGYAGWAISSALALASHYFAVFLVVPEAIWLLARAADRRAARRAVAGLAAAALALVPLVLHQRSQGVEWIQNTPLLERIKAAAGFLLLGPGRPIGLAVAVALAWLAALVVALRFGDARTRRGVLAALAVAAAFLTLPLLGALVGNDYFLDRNVLAALVPLAVVLAAGVASERWRRSGLVAGALLAAVLVWHDVTIARRDDLQRDDWRGVARVLGPEQASRAVIVLPGWQARPLGLYHGLRLMLDPQRVREIDTITYNGPRPRPGPRTMRPPPAPFRRVRSVTVQRMTVSTYRAPRGRVVQPSRFTRPTTWDGPIVFVDAGRRG